MMTPHAVVRCLSTDPIRVVNHEEPELTVPLFGSNYRSGRPRLEDGQRPDEHSGLRNGSVERRYGGGAPAVEDGPPIRKTSERAGSGALGVDPETKSHGSSSKQAASDSDGGPGSRGTLHGPSDREDGPSKLICSLLDMYVGSRAGRRRKTTFLELLTAGLEASPRLAHAELRRRSSD